jgi:hypothetical protein
VAIRARRTRLGWLGPAIVLVGLAVGAVGVWWMMKSRPKPGPEIDRIAIDQAWTVIVRREANSDRAMVELVRPDGTVDWQALVPRYAGRPGAPGLAAAKNAISVRVVRTRPELWVLSTRKATKLGAIGLDEYAPGGWNPAGTSAVVSVGDGVRSYEVVDGTRGSAVVAVDLERGAVLWHREVPGPVRTVTATPEGKVAVAAADRTYLLDRLTGRE